VATSVTTSRSSYASVSSAFGTLYALGARAVAESRVPTTAELRELMRRFPDELALAVPLS
jgi:hypothetical protein